MASTKTPFTITQFASIYGFPEVNTAIHNVVGVLSFGGGLYGVPQNQSTPYMLPPYSTSSTNDIQKYANYLGYSAEQMPNLIIYPVAGAVNDLNYTDDVLETTMDVASIFCGCPNPSLTIILYIFPSQYIYSLAYPIALAGITFNNITYVPNILSCSNDRAEIDLITNGVDTTGELTLINTIFQEATQKGINICLPTGDSGSRGKKYLSRATLSITFPTSSPYCTAVGGTSLICPSKTTYDESTVETVWNWMDGNYATGGGVSAYYPKPNYQQNINISSAMRNTPDIALAADPSTGIYFFFNGTIISLGGTSFSTPLFAAYLARLNPNTFINPLLYSADSSAFHDITSGNNNTTDIPNSYNAAVGYDNCTGLGSINGSNLNSIIKPVFVPRFTTLLAQTIVLNKTSLILNTINNTTFQLIPRILPRTTTNQNIQWTTNNPAIATVSNIGLVTAINIGNVNIFAQTQDGSNLTAISNITVITSI